jgi:hypothetical protein
VQWLIIVMFACFLGNINDRENLQVLVRVTVHMRVFQSQSAESVGGFDVASAARVMESHASRELILLRNYVNGTGKTIYVIAYVSDFDVNN